MDGVSLGERNPKGLQDDYVKFIRFGQWRGSQTKQGILAFITNHGFLDNPTFRGMRQSLINSFDSISVYDLHGNSKKKEKQSSGDADANVFDIQQGVVITLAVKGDEKLIQHCHLWGDRDHKYSTLQQEEVNTTQWNEIKPRSPMYLLIPQDNQLLPEYEKGWKITDIFPTYSTGILTARDHFTVQPSKEKLWEIIQDFIKLPVEVAREKYDLRQDVRDWQVALAQKDIIFSGNDPKNMNSYLYRPFDFFFTYFTGRSRGFHCTPRGKIMKHMVVLKNLGLITVRQVAEENFNHVFVTDTLVDCRITLSNKGYATLFPLKISKKENQSKSFLPEISVDNNLSLNFLKALADKISYTPTPETIFYYIYAILHSPTYRTRYAEFLKLDFPRIPLTSDNQLFSTLADYGEQLVSLHIRKLELLNNFITEYKQNGGNNLVDAGHPKYQSQTVIINKKGDKFTGVPEEVWNFQVGGYQVCQKWLKDRKDRHLTQEDINHYQRILVAVLETINLMREIDGAIALFPLP